MTTPFARCMTAAACLIAGLGLARAAFALPDPRPPILHATYIPKSVDFLAGTWCFADGIRARYALPSPGRLRVTRLTADRVAQFGEVSEFAIVEFGGGRFQLRPFKGDLSARFFGRIDGEDSFTFLDFTLYDEEQRRTVTHPLNQSARRCGAEISADDHSFNTRLSAA